MWRTAIRRSSLPTNGIWYNGSSPVERPSVGNTAAAASSPPGWYAATAASSSAARSGTPIGPSEKPSGGATPSTQAPNAARPPIWMRRRSSGGSSRRSTPWFPAKVRLLKSAEPSRPRSQTAPPLMRSWRPSCKRWSCWQR